MGVDLKSVGAYVQSLLAGGGPTVAAGSGAAVSNELLDLRSFVLGKVQQAGQAAGPYLGAALPGVFASGAAQTAPGILDRLTTLKNAIFPNTSGTMLAVYAAAIGGVAWIAIRLLRR